MSDIEPNPTAGMPYDHIVPPSTKVLDDMLSKIKGRMFFKKGAGFLGSLMCSHNFVWDETRATAWCNGSTIGWNPKFFTWLSTEERITVLAHEMWHTGYLHVDPARLAGRCPKYWNKAADYVINNALERDGFVFGDKLMSLEPCLDHQYDNMTTEAVYEALNVPPGGAPGTQTPGGFGNDVVPASGKDAVGKAISNVIKAKQASQMSKEAGVIPGETELLIDKFLNPILPWEVLLERFFTELNNDDYSWSRPSRRYEDEYLPSLYSDNGLEHLIYYLDISGSVSDADILRFNSEVKHIHEAYEPKRLTLVTFDTKIRDIYEFTDEMPFEKIVVHGRGGTSLDEVFTHIQEHRPSAAVVFSDLYCKPMEQDPGSPLIWVVVGNDTAKTHFGKIINIKNE